ncbi:AraC family transcriptional regulator [Paenibacillus selenitireducens]|uniref:AraC family transcriptional regulator n=1 Tax=Paenibacillus selenitireducens TaxID=1324314 RepID=A0A1T2XMN4_9BACL|nr:AraC family transcriptional regulator [Paenibacillus selenitireducens]OPA81006.1 AraC family transcriptional regulator [Paenibacillus selenitireducens]
MTGRLTEIDEILAYIQEHIDEPLPLSRLAGHVAYSTYHFTRIFKDRVGLPPLYYVSSLRLQKAKELLLSTNWSIRDIALEIGQQSLGTFTTRFTERVGVTPLVFRNSALKADIHLRSLQKLTQRYPLLLGSSPHDRIQGTVHSEVPFEGVILIGLFTKPIPEGLPLYGTLLTSLGDFCFTGVKPGTYYLMATSISWGMQARDVLLPSTTLRSRSKSPIIVGPASFVPHQEIMLRVPRLDDPPILISLPLLMNNFLLRAIQNSNR